MNQTTSLAYPVCYRYRILVVFYLLFGSQGIMLGLINTRRLASESITSVRMIKEI